VLLFPYILDIFLTVIASGELKVRNSGTYEAKIEEVHSGDDFILLVNLGIDGLFKRVRARLLGVDAPNAYKAGADTEAGRIREEIRRMLGGRCHIEIISEGKGGWIVRMHATTEGGERICVNDLLKDRGYVYTPVKQEA